MMLLPIILKILLQKKELTLINKATKEKDQESTAKNVSLQSEELQLNSPSMRTKYLHDLEIVGELKQKKKLNTLAASASLLVLSYFLILVGIKFSNFDSIIDTYERIGKADVLWLYGVSLCSLVTVVLCITIGFMNVFSFKRRNDYQTLFPQPLAEVKEDN